MSEKTKHHLGTFSLTFLAAAGFGAVLIFFYFNYCFTMKWADASGTAILQAISLLLM